MFADTHTHTHTDKAYFKTRYSVTCVSLNNVTACFTQKYEVTRKLNGILFVYLICKVRLLAL